MPKTRRSDSDETLHIYTRVSTVTQAEQGTSLETQRELGIKRASQLGMSYQIWDEGPASSHHEGIGERPKLNSLYIAMKEGKVKHLWVYDQSRLSRNDNVASIIRYECNKQGITLYTKDSVFDLSNPTDMLTKQVLDAMSEFENSTRAERTRLGKLNRVRSGHWHGGPPPFGYKLVDQKLVIDKSEARWVKHVFKEALRGVSIAKIKQTLDSNGVQTRRGKSLWSLGSIAAMLKNTHYAGRYAFVDKRSKTKIEVECPSIVNEGTWSAVQNKRQDSARRRNQSNATHKNFYLIRDLMFCGHCGRPLSGRRIKSRNEASYYCPNKEREWAKKGKSEAKWKRGLGCGFARALNITQADKLIWDLVKSIHSKSSTLKEEVKHRVLKEGGVYLRSDTELRTLEAKVKKLQRDHAALSETLGHLEANRLMGRLNEKAHEVAAERINASISQNATELEKARNELRGSSQSRKWVDWLKAFGDEINKLDALDDHKRKAYLLGLVKRIDVTYAADAREHHMMVTMHLPIIEDGIEYTGVGKHAKTYKIVEGTDKTTVVAKKKDGRG